MIYFISFRRSILFVFIWYRFKYTLKQRKKKKNLIQQQQRHFNSPATNNHYTAAPRYASPDISSSIHSGYLSVSKSQSEALIEPSASTIYKNMEKFIDEQSLKQDSTDKKPTEMQAVTQC
jgi:hypothetical protein